MKIVSTEKAPKAIGPYSQAVEAKGFVFCSGQIGINPSSGNVEGTTIEEQTRQVMNNLSAVLQAAGSDLGKVVKCTVFLQDIEEFQAFNEVYGEFFSSNPPSRTTIQAGKLPRGAKVEIDAIAMRD